MLRLVGGRAVTTGAAWCALGRLAGAQVAGIGVDPHMVVLTAARPSGEITVMNPHASRAEFSVDLRFGFATTDSNGKLTVRLTDGPDSASAANWVTPYPRQFTLRPGGSRTVRLLARPPADLSDGEYWARLTVHARDDSSRPIGDGDSTSANVHIAMETATVIPVFYRKGAVSTGITVSALEATAMRNGIGVEATLTRTGNGAFIGTAHLMVRDSAGNTVAVVERQIAVYRTMRPRWSIALPASASGQRCSVALRLSTNRRDVPRNLIVQSAAAETVVAVVKDSLP
ncbi:MAG: hypothetical protein M3R65_11010 [Gemmatimonadota bacterium]|nr:hypothetical protein [Gemmatimonadota bacterium]